MKNCIHITAEDINRSSSIPNKRHKKKVCAEIVGAKKMINIHNFTDDNIEIQMRILVNKYRKMESIDLVRKDEVKVLQLFGVELNATWYFKGLPTTGFIRMDYE